MKRLLLACLIVSQWALAHAERFPAPDIQLGDFWVYKYTEAKGSEAARAGLFEHVVMWKSTKDEWVVGSRTAFTDNPKVMLPGVSIKRCLVAVGIGMDMLDMEFCDGSFDVGAKVARAGDNGASSETVFEGIEAVTTPAGEFSTRKFRVTEKFGGNYTDRSVPEAAQRVSDWWYASEARSVVRRRLVWYDAKGQVLLARSQELVQMKLRAPSVMSSGAPLAN